MTRSIARVIAVLCIIIAALGSIAAYALSTRGASIHPVPKATYAEQEKIASDAAILALTALRFDQGLDAQPTDETQLLRNARDATESLIRICRAQPTLVIEGRQTIKEKLEDEVNSLHMVGEWLAERRGELELALEQHCA